MIMKYIIFMSIVSALTGFVVGLRYIDNYASKNLWIKDVCGIMILGGLYVGVLTIIYGEMFGWR